MTSADDTWHQTACILCECNCGIEVRLGGDDGRRFERIRGDKAHPSSKGYTCEKALRLDHYQNGRNRLTAPLRRRPDGSFEEVDWDTAIREVAERLLAVRDTHGGEAIFYYGGGGQGNHLGGAYSGATLRAFGARYRSNALAQEKTGEIWVNGRLFGAGVVRGDFEHAEVALFVGKNPYQSHGLPRARTTLKEIARDPARALVVIDPRRSETAELADIHLAVRPGTDAWCLAALAAVIVQEGLLDRSWLVAHTAGLDDVERELAVVPVALFAERCGIAESELRGAARRIADAGSVAVAEDLGIQMNRHSTLASYLEKLVWLLTGNLAKPGAQYLPSSLVALARSDGARANGSERRSPVVGARIIGGLVPCNVIPDEILTEHPARYRAMIVESGNPAHSLADTARMREALQALDVLVVIDVAMTETARLADYVLPAPTQFEKWEATFFNFDFPHNVFHLRRPLLDPPPGVLPEPEIHARLVEAAGLLPAEKLAPLRAAVERGRAEFAEAFFAATAADPALGALAPVVLYRTLGPTLPGGAASAAVLWGAAHRCALANPQSLARAGFSGERLEPGERLFEAILASPSGLVFTVDEADESWRRVRATEGRVQLAIPELLEQIGGLVAEEPSARDPAFPFVLSAGERRSFTANTILRDPAWRKRDPLGALRVSPIDAQRIGLVEGGLARLSTKRGSAEVIVEVSETMQPGHVSLPNGMGLDEADGDGRSTRTGVAPNELTAGDERDWLAGTPWHKHVPARLEPVAADA
ncbi:MAG TPA: molybdopterin-dependent oxidoreductase [Acidimicrobiales bacterium]|nr:molybdopterin-dependent oxidoreductase [Acidimicrobiales bacterium]